MARTRDYLAELCKGWQVEQVRQIVTETLDELINPYVYAEAAALIEEHQAAGRDVVLVSASGEEIVRPIGELLGVTDVIATRMGVEDGRYNGEVEFYAAGPSKVDGGRRAGQGAGLRPRRVVTRTPTRSATLPLLEARRPSHRGQPGPGAAPARRRERLAGAGVPPSDPAGPAAARAPGRPGGRGRDRRRRGGRDRHRLVRPAPPHPHCQAEA